MYADSRYANGRFYKAHNSRTWKYQTTVSRRFPTDSAEYFYYVWLDTDRIDFVAYKLFGDPSAWWQIMDYNPEIIDPMNIKPNTLLRIPNV
jgi:hypothetical protein